MNNKKLWPALLLLAVVIIACSFITRTLTSSKTLYEYALEHPEYGNNVDSTDAQTETENIPAGTGDMADSNSTDVCTDEYESSTTLPNESSSEDISDLPTETTTEQTQTHPERFEYADGFFYEPITLAVENRITGISYPSDNSAQVALDELRYLNVLYNDFNGNIQTGELICNEYIALDLLEIFYELYLNSYQFEEISLIDKYNGDDTLSMEHNNTSCFNYRVVDGSTNLSKHAYGLAIDINPFYNPYVIYNKDGSGETYISPKGSEAYENRSIDFPYKIDENDLCYKLFIEHGFTWGGNWNSSKDYQHFQKVK